MGGDDPESRSERKQKRRDQALFQDAFKLQWSLVAR